MRYTETTESYNERRYGKPWMAIVGTSLTRDFTFIDWDGRPGYAGEFSFMAEPGTLIAYGQKDLRKGRGGVDGYQICMPDGSLPTCTERAVELRKMTPEQRWRTVARQKLDYAINQPAEAWRYDEWAKGRNQMAAKYSAMLGVPDPVLAGIAEALGLTDQPAVEPVAVSMADFGL